MASSSGELDLTRPAFEIRDVDGVRAGVRVLREMDEQDVKQFADRQLR